MTSKSVGLWHKSTYPLPSLFWGVYFLMAILDRFRDRHQATNRSRPLGKPRPISVESYMYRVRSRHTVLVNFLLQVPWLCNFRLSRALCNRVTYWDVAGRDVLGVCQGPSWYERYIPIVCTFENDPYWRLACQKSHIATFIMIIILFHYFELYWIKCNALKLV